MLAVLLHYHRAIQFTTPAREGVHLHLFYVSTFFFFRTAPVPYINSDSVAQNDHNVQSVSIKVTNFFFLVLAQMTPEASPSSSREFLEGDAVARPSIYTHAPTARLAPLEEYYGHGPEALRSIELLEELKTSRLDGLYNLSFLFLCFSLAYLSIRNVLEFGFLAGPSSLCVEKLALDANESCRFLLALLPCLLASYVLIKVHVLGFISAQCVLFSHVAGLGAYYLTFSAILLQSDINPIFALFLGMFIVVVSLKQHSYVLTNLLLAEETYERKTARKARTSKSCGEESHAQSSSMATSSSSSTTSKNSANSYKREKRTGNQLQSPPSAHEKAALGDMEVEKVHRVPYPRNITFGNFFYFCISPTLVYETSYPRLARIRVSYVAWYLLQAAVCMAVDYFLLMQFCVPVWRHSRDLDRMWYFVMKLALPWFIGWLLMFFGFFHCMLNAISELTLFADRQFYLDWWNATTLDSFWRKWNTLVHEWCLRHLYVESMSRHNVKAQTAVLGTFLFSAVMHEYVCLVGFRLLRPYMFAGMCLQVPLIKVSRQLSGTRQGNFLMWTTLFVGQSVIMLLYVRDYLTQNGTLMC